MTQSQIQLQDIKNRIAEASLASGREKDSVKLVAVSKTFDIDDIKPVLDSGQRIFGENRVQEAQNKWPQLRQEYPGVELHLIGPLQTNKVREAVALFDVIQTLDRPKLLQALGNEIRKQNKPIKVLIQVNVGREPQKAGVLPEDFASFLTESITQLGSALIGLMCIPPVDQDPNPYFQSLKDLADAHKLPIISMGMSSDFEAAIKMGASHVRVGSAIFGTRPKLV